VTISSAEPALLSDSNLLVPSEQLPLTPAALQAPQFGARFSEAEEADIMAGHLGLTQSSKI